MLADGLTIFAGAFLLFQVQPLLGKYLLPWFGGGPAVWTACLLFFQVFLLGGYAYAHLLTRYMKPRGQAIAHLLALLAALACLPITPSEAWKVHAQQSPLWAILLLLSRDIGAAYLVLASTGPLLQSWFRHYSGQTSPYRLYALSNLGSLLGLLTYPLFFEVHFTRPMQASLWQWGFGLYSAGCAFCAIRFWFRESSQAALGSAAPAQVPPPAREQLHRPVVVTVWQRLQWLLWPACASTLLLAVTNKLCLDVAAVPLLWVLPLSAYLLSFVICFDNPRWYLRLPFTILLALAMAAMSWALFKGFGWPFWIQAGTYIAGLFVCCMTCHGELYRARPRPEWLTQFYLLVAAGGALGGLFVSLIAPALFTNYYELHWGLFLCALLVAGQRTLEATGGLHLPIAPTQPSHGHQLPNPKEAMPWAARDWQALGLAGLWVCLFALAACLWLQARRTGTEIVHKSRNFYGVLTVFEHRKDEPNGHHFLLQHGRITHGFQFAHPQLQTWPTTYYGPDSGVGLAFKSLALGPRRVGIVGLGTGTLATYARPGDYLRFYEINPQVRHLARSRFTFLDNCRGDYEIILGDARLALERESAQQFDLLALDAFSSDSIPVHLLTKEAFELYLRHLKPGGMIAVHTSNHFLDLDPVVLGLARALRLHSAVIDHDPSREQWWLYASTWILLSRDPDILAQPLICSAAAGQSEHIPQLRPWSDDFSSLFQILK